MTAAPHELQPHVQPTAASQAGGADLGELGGAVDAAEATTPLDVMTFTYFGQRVRVNWMLTDADLIDFIEMATRIDVDATESIVALKDALRHAIDPRDFDGFWQTARDHRQSLEQRMSVLHALYAAATDRPTQRSTASSGGPSTTPAVSGPVSSSPASSPRARALQLLAGRPDLQLIVADAPVVSRAS